MPIYRRHSFFRFCLLSAGIAAPVSLAAQEDSAYRRVPVPVDSVRASLLYVSNRAADLPKADYARQVAQKVKTDSTYAARSAGVMEFRKISYASRADAAARPTRRCEPSRRRARSTRRVGPAPA